MNNKTTKNSSKLLMGFACAINCMDGRVQDAVKNYMKENYGVDYVDMVTEPGPNKILADTFLYGDVSEDGQVTAYDAALTAQKAVGLITLTSEQTQKADVSGDSNVSAYDAALIAQKAVGLK